MNLLTLQDWSQDDIEHVLSLANEMKRAPQDYDSVLDQQTLLMLFQKPSTRTRASFETGMTDLGGHGIYMDQRSSQLSRGESLKDTAKVLSRYADAIMARLYSHTDAEALAEHADVPIINGLTDVYHPCQALADYFTLQDTIDIRDGKLAYIGDGNNVAHSLLNICGAMGLDLHLACPPGYEPRADIVTAAKERAGSRADIQVTSDTDVAVMNAQAVYTDTWVSMGDEEEKGQRIADFGPYQVNTELLEAGNEPLIMHPLPAHRGDEITADVLDSPHSIVYDQAENRLHVQKALLQFLLSA